MAANSQVVTRKFQVQVLPLVPCGCTSEVRISDGHKTVVFDGDRRLELCRACTVERDRDQTEASFYEINW